MPAERRASPPPDSMGQGKRPSTSARAAGSGNSRTDTVSSSIPLLDASDLKLHAIAWSPEPDQRIAVINNSITREGDTIDGFNIVRIAQEEIVISKDRERWRLMLR
jgi:hypothetical protein